MTRANITMKTTTESKQTSRSKNHTSATNDNAAAMHVPTTCLHHCDNVQRAMAMACTTRRDDERNLG